MLTISGVQRVKSCIASATLPHTMDSPDERTSHGTVVHKYLSDVNDHGPEIALDLAPDEYKEVCKRIQLENLPIDPDHFACEVGFAWNWNCDTARELFRGDPRRKYISDEGELCGTADVVGILPNAVIVFDFKTGFAKLGRPEDNMQLTSLAVAAARAYGKKRAIIGFIRIWDDGSVHYDKIELNEQQLNAKAKELAELMHVVSAAIDSGEASTPVEGSHCKYCPALNSCPAKMGLVRQVAMEAVLPPAKSELFPITLTRENFPAVLTRLEAAELMLARVRTGIEDFARSGAIALPDGESFGPVPTPRETIDSEAAYAILEKEYGEKVASATMEVSKTFTKKKLEAALKVNILPVRQMKMSDLKEEALIYLRNGGACTVTMKYPVKRYVPNAKLLAAGPVVDSQE